MTGLRLIVCVNWEDRIVRVFDHTPAVCEALASWRKHDAAYTNGQIPDDEYLTFEDYMEQAGALRYAIQTVEL